MLTRLTTGLSNGLANRWRDRPIPATLPAENSLLLRILVQALVSIGILATDIAAADVVDSLKLAWWAIPLSWGGASVSWLRRDKRNIAIKFIIAILMLVALGLFFGNLISRRNDTRLVLVELLIQLQVLHSFDLPRRKDLGYSMMIGLILIGVSATLSQTLTFAPFLLAFLAIALPVLVLDYSSALGLIGELTQKRTALTQLSPDLSPKRLGTILLVVTVLGLGIFAFLPRLPGYQLRAFPVSAPIDVQGRFDNQQVFNSGYARAGEQGQGSGEGEGEGGTGTIRGNGRSPARGAGKADDEVYYGFNTQINQNLRGALKPKLLMRVRAQVEGYWRVMAFDRYTGQGWEVSRNDNTTNLRRSSWSYQFEIPPAPGTGRSREVIQTFTIVADMPNLIPIMANPRELYFPTEEIAIDPEGGLRSPVPLSDGMTYTAISAVPYRDRTALNQSAPLQVPPIYPKTITRHYLDVPAKVAPRLRAKTEELLANSERPLKTPYETALFITKELKQRYSLQPDLPYLKDDQDLAEAFLYDFKGGYPDHFSTTLTMMLRSIGLPARLAVGFGPGEFNPFTGLYLVRNTDAYAVTEVYFPRYGWFAFDPIPGHELFPPSLEENTAFSVLRAFWQWVAGWMPSPVRNWFSGVFLAIGKALGWLFGWVWLLLNRGGTLWTGLILSVLGAFAVWLGWQGWRWWAYRRWLGRLQPMERVYQQLLGLLAEQGLGKLRSQTPLEYAQSLQGRCGPEVMPVVESVSADYVDWRYGGAAVDVARLGGQVQALKRGRKRRLWETFWLARRRK